MSLLKGEPLSILSETAELQKTLQRIEVLSVDVIREILETNNNFILANKSAFKVFLISLNNLLIYRNFLDQKEIFSLILFHIQNFCFSSDDLGGIFKDNKTFLLFLYESGILTIETVIKLCERGNNKDLFLFFWPEIKEHSNSFYEDQIGKNGSYFAFINHYSSKDKIYKFKKKRKLGENDDKISKIIKRDNAMEFQQYISRTNTSLNEKIKRSLFDQTDFLDKIGNVPPSLIEYSAICGSIDTFKFLLLNGAEMSSKLAEYAVAGGNYDIIHILEGRRIDFFYQSCVKTAIQYQREDIANYLNVSANDLEYIIEYYNLPLFVVIINSQINSQKEKTKCKLLKTAILNGYLDIVEFLFSFEASDELCKEDKEGNTALHLAVLNGHLDIVIFLVKKYLLNNKKSSQINKSNKRGFTPLHLACLNGYSDIVDCLINLFHQENGINETANNGMNALHMACQNGYHRVAEILINVEEIDVNCKMPSCNGNTPLILTSMYGCISIVEMLVKSSKIDVNMKNNDGFAAIHWAAMKGNSEIVEILMRRGDINVCAQTYDGWTPLHWAVSCNHIYVVDLLLFNSNYSKSHINNKKKHFDIHNDIHNDIQNEKDGKNVCGYIKKMSSKDNKKYNIDLLNSQTDDGLSAYHMAQMNGHKDIVEKLDKIIMVIS